MRIRMSPFEERVLHVDGFHAKTREAALKALRDIEAAIDILWPTATMSIDNADLPKKDAQS